MTGKSSTIMVGTSPPFARVQETIRQVAPTSITVLITGESGTGKELAARALHEASPRSKKPLVTVNCGAIPEGLLESELFGHEKGSFTGAHEARKGYFEQADTGTILLDEIGEMPPATQVKLLRILEEKAFQRVGASEKRSVDVRVIAATNRDLESAVERGEFRQDLYYRLSAVKIHMPSLRERKEDIPRLADHFAFEIAAENGIEFGGFTEDAYHTLSVQPWPGNIRELKNVLERIIILEKGSIIDSSLLEKHFIPKGTSVSALPVPLYKTPEQAEREIIYRTLLDIRMAINDIRAFLMSQPVQPAEDLRSSIDAQVSGDSEIFTDLSLREVEREQIIKALDRSGGNRRKAARSLGIGERTLYRKLKEYGLD